MKVLTTPQEVEVWYVLPALRKELAIELKKKGLTQTKIAEILNVTKAAITQYFKKTRAKEMNLEKIKPEIIKSAEKLKEGSPLVKELNALLETVRKTKLICEIHKACCNLEDCNVCFEK